jgi:hypothetical protein
MIVCTTGALGLKALIASPLLGMRASIWSIQQDNSHRDRERSNGIGKKFLSRQKMGEHSINTLFFPRLLAS